MRLNKYLAMTGAASRRKSDALIKEGKVRVNGSIVTEPWYDVNESDNIAVAGAKIKRDTKKYYVLLHKPKSVVSTVSDEKSRKTVVDLIGLPERIFPIGRLDYSSTGVLLCTNDGDLAYRLAHPKYHIEKVYAAEINRLVKKEDIAKLESGIDIGEKENVSVKIRKISKYGKKSFVELVLVEGRNRQIHRMFETLGYYVNDLERKEYAGITVKGLQRGDWRFLTAREVKTLYKKVGLKYGNS